MYRNAEIDAQILRNLKQLKWVFGPVVSFERLDGAD